jgi:hypothetical protein
MNQYNNEIQNEIQNEIKNNNEIQNEIQNNRSITQLKLSKDDFTKCIKWATNKPSKLEKKTDISMKQQRLNQQIDEKTWGNSILKNNKLVKNPHHQDKLNGQWTTLVGESLVHDVLCLRGENPRKPIVKDGYQPDWETDKYIYEVKTSTWCVSGTAGEKVLSTWIKYQQVPELYQKPLYIVCVAYQEYELTEGKTVYFGNKITNKTKQALNLAKAWNIHYISFSEFISSINLS